MIQLIKRGCMLFRLFVSELVLILKYYMPHKRAIDDSTDGWLLKVDAKEICGR
jgi:hypothetical protein